MNADQIKAAYPGYAGWNDRAAIEADFRATNGQGKGPPQSSYSSPGNVSIPQINVPDPVETARKLREFTIQSNQPAIAQYQKQLTSGDPNSIQDRYDKIIANIKGAGTVATNQTTQAITSGLGARGLLPNSPEGQKALVEGLLPVQTSFGGLETQAGYQNVQDINQINNAIAALQAGNPAQAQQTGLGFSQIGAGLQTAQLQAQTAIRNAQLQAETQRKIAEQEFQYRPIFPGGALYNTQNQQTIIPGVSIGNIKDPISLYYAWLAQQQK